MVDETKQALDYLENIRGIKRFCCIGLCAGANAVAVALSEDHRVGKGVFINPFFTRAAQGIMEQGIIYRKYAIFSLKSWIRLLTLRSDLLRLRDFVITVFRKKILHSFVKSSEYDSADNKIREFFQIIKLKKAQMLMVFSHTEFGDVYLKEVLGKEYQSLIKSGILSIERIKNADHSITQLVCQNELINVISNFLCRKPWLF